MTIEKKTEKPEKLKMENLEFDKRLLKLDLMSRQIELIKLSNETNNKLLAIQDELIRLVR
jgi:hypothetical protein|tara:strand:+ start:3882 stop:4061 length:180 start_codon:yes stop_codon:yes gene_type:complete